MIQKKPNTSKQAMFGEIASAPIRPCSSRPSHGVKASPIIPATMNGTVKARNGMRLPKRPRCRSDRKLTSGPRIALVKLGNERISSP